MACPLAQLLVGIQAVVDAPKETSPFGSPLLQLVQADAGRLVQPGCLEHDGTGPLGDGVGHEVVAVKAFSHQRHKPIAGLQLAAVGADAQAVLRSSGAFGQGCGFARSLDRRAEQLLQVVQLQHHQEVAAGSSRIMPEPTRAR